MDHIPVGTILFLIVLDILLVTGVSAFCGVVVARAGGRNPWLGALVGVLVPFVGPAVWAVVVLIRQPELGRVGRAPDRAGGAVLAGGLMALAAVAFLGGSPVPWGQVSGGYHEYALTSDASAADSFIGLTATVGTSLLLAACAAFVLFSTAQRRVGLVVIAVGTAWFGLAVNSFTVFNAIDGISEAVRGVSGGNAEVSASPGGGLWAYLVAGLVTLTAGLVAAAQRPLAVPTAVPVPVIGSTPVQAAWTPAPGTTFPPIGSDYDYGDPT